MRGRTDKPGLDAARVWTTGSWFLRDERMYLMPGDSPMGLRLPLDSLPWVSKADYPYLIEQPTPRPAWTAVTRGTGNTLSPERPLTSRRRTPVLKRPLRQTVTGRNRAPATVRLRSKPRFSPAPPAIGAWITRTALCVEVRDPRRASGPKAEAVGNKSGVIYIFMPPLEKLEDYLDLLAAIEATAEELRVKIVLEGYPPPRDPRLKLLQVTPDPGVIEVNIHPVTNWGELVEQHRVPVQRRIRVAPVRREVHDRRPPHRHRRRQPLCDGRRHAGGQPVPAQARAAGQPAAVLAQPPVLSYLFSGMFVGPTSQAPRVDEARNDQLYELEIAIEQIYKNREMHGQSMPPWLVDRTLRNILIDATGNTHRSEFSIDKMYSPDSATGRLGLLELRAFEMPPHPHMSSVQQLLLRALVARFWKTPYQAPATRWGTELHDRFMLPTFIKMDFDDVIAEMRSAGYAFDTSWFAPHYEFRFPLVGAVQSSGMELTLRNALEPWHVMGEEGAPAAPPAMWTRRWSASRCT